MTLRRASLNTGSPLNFPKTSMIPHSVLDLAPINQGSDAAQSFRNTLDLARHAERWGYRRFWLAEHHGMPGIASAATAVLIGHVAGGNLDHPRRRRRHHAAQPFAAGHRRAVRNAGVAVSRTHRPGTRPRAGFGSDDGAGAAPRPRLGCPRISAGRAGTGRLFFSRVTPAGARRARIRAERAAVDSGVESLWRTARRGVWPAVCVRIAFRAGADDAGHRGLPRAVSSVGAIGPTLCDARLQRVRRRHRRRGALSCHVDAAGLHQPAQWPARATAASGRRVWPSISAPGSVRC